MITMTTFQELKAQARELGIKVGRKTASQLKSEIKRKKPSFAHKFNIGDVVRDKSGQSYKIGYCVPNSPEYNAYLVSVNTGEYILNQWGQYECFRLWEDELI